MTKSKLNTKSIYLFCIGALIIACVFSIGHHHFDEHFQILEFANYKLGLTNADNLPWEFHNQIRSTIQPTIAYGLFKTFHFFGIENPFVFATLLRLLSAALAFYTMLSLYNVFKSKVTNPNQAKWFLILSFSLWFVLYNGVRFSSENWSGALFILGVCIYLSKKITSLRFLKIGVLFGLSFLFRYQSGFLIFGFFAWLLFIKKESWKSLFQLVVGVVLMAILGVLIDKWFYGEWTITAYNYFEENIINNKAAAFGVDPWWKYFELFLLQGIPPFSLLFIVSFILLVVFKPKSLLTWIVLPFLLIHFMIGHKEMRFLFPIVYFLPIILIYGIQIVEERFIPKLSTKPFFKGFMKFFLIVNFILAVIIALKPAEVNTALYRSVYNNYAEPTDLYFITEYPNEKVLEFIFYKRELTTFKRIKTIEEVDFSQNKTILVAYKNQEIPNSRKNESTLVYSTYKPWMQPFNIGGWMERSSYFRVYQLK